MTRKDLGFAVFHTAFALIFIWMLVNDLKDGRHWLAALDAALVIWSGWLLGSTIRDSHKASR